MPKIESSRIMDALSHLGKARPNVFGADDHGFRLNPALTQDEAISFERKHSIQLPSDFREFVTEIGNGGAGPFYGIFPVGVVDDNFGFRDWHEVDDLVGVLSEPFRFEEEWNDVSNMPPPELLDQNESEYYRRLDEFERVYWGTAIVSGAMPICHEGCAVRILLVLSGKQAGMLWEDKRSEYGGLSPVNLADGSPASFAKWYDEWLDTCLAASKSR